MINLMVIWKHVSIPHGNPAQRRGGLGNRSRRSHQCGDEEKKGIIGENWLKEEDGESKHAREAIYMKGERSVLGASKQRLFQVKDADDREQ